MSVGPSIPRFTDLRAFRADPLAFLRTAQAHTRDLVVIAEKTSIFSRARNCVGVVAAFGPAAIRQVLVNPEIFGAAVTVSERLSLPRPLMRLSTSIFAMRGATHRSRRRLLASALAPTCLEQNEAAITEGWNAYADGLRHGRGKLLLSEMRRLISGVAGRLLFAETEPEFGQSIQAYFHLRRALADSARRADAPARHDLIDLGGHVNRVLNDRLRALRRGSAQIHSGSECVLARISNLELRSGRRLPHRELVAHGSALFMATSEPMAVALTWILLLLSQRADLRRALRDEVERTCGQPVVPECFTAMRFPLLHAVIRETLRLLPPNAIMVRLTRRPSVLCGHRLPARCEVIVSPFVAHRDRRYFVRPDAFDPSRWRDWKPRPYSYFPFGAGPRNCIGKELADYLLFSLLARILNRFDVVLARDQNINWMIDFALRPLPDPIVQFRPASSGFGRSTEGRLRGPAAALVGLSGCPGYSTPHAI